ncbi:MAG: hypothetical protein DRI94_07095 [Bacteroidetes bacterium]|nr:MAG: hypothetical protein DRI94_07095 [Bacteroidota bacterium]
MKYYIYTAFFILFNYNNSFSQNLLKESNFYTDNISWLCDYYPYNNYQIDYHYNYWESQYSNEAKYRKYKWQRYKYRSCGNRNNFENCKCCNYHSPDLEFRNLNNGNRDVYVGIGYSELIQQKMLSQNLLTSGKFYKVTCRINVPETYQNGHNTITNKSELKFMLAKNKVKYKKPDCLI